MSDTSQPGEIGVPSIRVPKAVEESLNAPPHRADFTEQGYSTLINCYRLADLNLSGLYPPGLDFSPEPGVGAIKH